MEIQNCLQELLHDDNTEENGVQLNYFDLIASKSQESLLCFEGIKILPPLLSEVEKNEMRDYRRKAVDLEQKHFEARRQKYSNLLLKVMDIMDRCQRKGGKNRTKTPIPEGNSSNDNKGKENVQAQEKIIISKTNNHHVAGESNNGSIEILQDNVRNYKSFPEERKRKEGSNQNVKDDLPDSSLIFQKPKLYNSSSSPRRNKVDESINSTNESDRTSQKLQNLSLDRESSASSTGTTIASNKLHGEHLDSKREITAGDSLASTVLSMAFTDSSVTTQLSTMEGIQQTVKPVQRKLNMDNVNQNPNHLYYQSMEPLTSTPNELQRPDTRSSQRAKKKAPVKHVASKKSTETYTEQDKALEKLEMMRKKLLEEKEKQVALLRQQELARLKKNKDNQKQFNLLQELNTQSDERDMYNDEQFNARPSSDMYSISERSFEGSLSLKGDDQNEAESASDKENNHYTYDPQHRMYHDMNSVVHYRQDTLENRSQAKQHGPFSPSPYVRQEFLKQFEMAMNQGCDGRDKFSILTAYSKGFLTRCLLKAEKVQAIIKTIKDTSEFLADISKEGTNSYQDKSLQQRVQAQLVAAKQKLYDIFFKIAVHDRMSYITHSRNVAKEREERQYDKSKKSARKLSSATLKAMQRRVVEQNENSDVKRASTHSPLGRRKNWDIRVLKPVQSTKSPQLQDKARLAGRRRPGTAPSPRHSIIKKNTYNNRPATAMTKQSNRKSISRRSVENDSASLRKPPRMSLEGKLQTTVKRTKANDEEKSSISKLPVKRSLTGGQTYRVTRGDEEDKKTQQQYSRPSRLSLEGNRQVRESSAKQNPVKSNIRPKTASGTRRVTRSMAAKFNKS
ncbi:zinc finger CCCH domain-containing protein 13-like [Actinia tenebrosa]|uniref:Zinc finger CCCH domain-containing protein 13-like n=1 Tax=Actinia tenebrosa TaxID=6105 RepID=A0A6P8I197_ACTTE|nr:zinc finger CCCH domain-containing protein 13-like [Actinia tenebrosa]